MLVGGRCSLPRRPRGIDSHGEMKKRRKRCRQTLSFPGLITFFECLAQRSYFIPAMHRENGSCLLPPTLTLPTTHVRHRREQHQKAVVCLRLAPARRRLLPKGPAPLHLRHLRGPLCPSRVPRQHLRPRSEPPLQDVPVPAARAQGHPPIPLPRRHPGPRLRGAPVPPPCDGLLRHP
jgi:hypothetical protein